MARTAKNEKLTKTILSALYTGAAIVFVLSSPYGTRRLIKALGYELKKGRERERFLWTVAYLRRRKYISHEEGKDGTIKIVLTEEGRKRALVYNLDSLTLLKAKRWDGKWRIIAFDIPESKKMGRHALTEQLKKLGCVMLQRSVWAWPYECKNEIDFIAETFEVGKYVHYIVADSITSEKFLKYRFKLA
jgi:hypothetical protein